MKKFFAAALMTAAAFMVNAEVVDVNGTFKLDDKGNAIDWRSDIAPNNPGKVEFVKGEGSNSVTITAPAKGSCGITGKFIVVKHGDKIKVSVEVPANSYGMIGIYLHTAKGGYITSMQRVFNASKTPRVEWEFTIDDPLKKGHVVGKVRPFLRMYNGRSTNFKNVIVEKTAAE